MFRFSPLRDPRAALFGLTMFSQQNPQLEKQLEMIAGILEAARNSLSVIRGEMHNFEASMLSATAAPQPEPEFATKPVHQEEPQVSYTNPNYSQSSSMTNSYQDQSYAPANDSDAMESTPENVTDQLQRLMRQNPANMNDFLDELENLIRKYRK